VSTAFHLLSDEEVRQIRLIIETLEHSTFDFLQLEFGSGVIIEICVQDAQFIEYGQALFRVRPAKTA
jgi:hypothetical protein